MKIRVDGALKVEVHVAGTWVDAPVSIQYAVINGGVKQWFARQLQAPDYLVIEVEDMHETVVKAYHENNGRLFVSLCSHPTNTGIQEFIQSLNYYAK